MKLSEDELRMVEQLRKFQRGFHRLRFFCLVGFSLGIIGVGIASSALAAVVSRLASDTSGTVSDRALTTATNALAMAYIYPLIIICFAGSALGLVYIFSIWRGDSKTMLLLRLIDELEKRDT
jgi:hypothetical protein